MATDVESFLTGKVASASFPDGAYGTVVGGRIVRPPQIMQQRDYTTGDPIVYPDSGQPAMQLVVHVQTDLRDPTIPDDDGVRALYIKGQMRAALIEALKATGTKSPTTGGELYMRYERDEPVTLKNGRPGNAQKIYKGKYVPALNTATSEFLTDPAAASPAAGSPAPTADDMRAGARLETQAASFRALTCPQGVDPARWAVMNEGQRRQMYEALGLPVHGEPPF